MCCGLLEIDILRKEIDNLKIALNVKDKDVRKASKKAKQRLSCKYSDYLFNDNFLEIAILKFYISQAFPVLVY